MMRRRDDIAATACAAEIHGHDVQYSHTGDRRPSLPELQGFPILGVRPAAFRRS
jgi:hypothetical protein